VQKSPDQKARFQPTGRGQPLIERKLKIPNVNDHTRNTWQTTTLQRRSRLSRETFGRRFRRGRRPSPSAVDDFLRVA